MKKRFRSTLVIITILGLSVFFGWLFDTAYTEQQKKIHPREYFSEVMEMTFDEGITNHLNTVYALIKVRSGFDAGLLAEDGGIGLFRLTPEQYEILSRELDIYTDPGLLYEPRTNLRLGIRWVRDLSDRYENDRKALIAATFIGEETVDLWLSDTSLTDGDGKLISVPDGDTADYVKKVEKAIETYKKLYE